MFLLRPIILPARVIHEESQLELLRLETYKHPDEINTWYNLGALYYEKGETDLAIEAWQEVIKRNPENADAYHEMGVAFGSLGQYDEAYDLFKKAISCNPDHIQAHYNLGVISDVLGMRAEAWKQTKILRRFDPILSEMLNRQLKRRYKQSNAAA